MALYGLLITSGMYNRAQTIYIKAPDRQAAINKAKKRRGVRSIQNVHEIDPLYIKRERKIYRWWLKENSEVYVERKRR